MVYVAPKTPTRVRGPAGEMVSVVVEAEGFPSMQAPDGSLFEVGGRFHKICHEERDQMETK